MRKISIATVLAVVAAVTVTPAIAKPDAKKSAASTNASLYVVHGIPGVNGFPVEVCVNGKVAIDSFTFANFVGPIALPAATYQVAVQGDTAAVAGDDCLGPFALGPLPVALSGGVSYTIVAHLTEAGAPTASVFTNDLSPTARGKARVILHHTAAAPEVDVKLARDWYNEWSPTALIPEFANGDQETAQLRPGEWQAGLLLDGTTVFGPATLTFKPFTTSLYYAVGVFPETFTLVRIEVPGTK